MRDHSRRVHAAGNLDPFWVRTGICECGDIRDGISFSLGNRGGWVIPIDEVASILIEALDERMQWTRKTDEHAAHDLLAEARAAAALVAELIVRSRFACKPPSDTTENG